MAKPFVTGSLEKRKSEGTHGGHRGRRSTEGGGGATVKREACERERYLAEYGDERFPGTFSDFQEMVIQFGYVRKSRQALSPFPVSSPY
eukprot:COSAG03_NODE_7336_length_932_cov_2.639856_2_plen_89_part_00